LTIDNNLAIGHVNLIVTIYFQIITILALHLLVVFPHD
jgi:hypothetical protein